MSTTTGQKIDISALDRRRFAHPFDHRVEYTGETRGHDASQDAIGGYYGCRWNEIFRDQKTGAMYIVSCHDGTYSSKNAHESADEEWMQIVQHKIIERTRQEIASGATEIRLSREEWAIMAGRIFDDWFDLLSDEQTKTVADANRYKLEGEVGTIKGIQVVVDPKCVNPLGDPPCDAKLKLEQALAQIDLDENLAEFYDY